MRSATAGSCCMSASMKPIVSPAACSSPANMAASLPKLRENSRMRTVARPVAFDRARKHAHRFVAAPVVHEHELVVVFGRVKARRGRREERRQIRRFVVARHDQREIHRFLACLSDHDAPHSLALPPGARRWFMNCVAQCSPNTPTGVARTEEQGRRLGLAAFGIVRFS